MELISIIPDFKPLNDPRLLSKAEALKPKIHYTDYPRPTACWMNGKPMEMEALFSAPLRRGDQAVLDFGRHLVGRLTLDLSAAGSHQDAPAFFQLDLTETADELAEDPEGFQGWLSRSWFQRERLHVDVLPAVAALPRRYAFRYVRLTVLDTSPKYQMVLKGASCRAESAAQWENVPKRDIRDEELRRIYDISLLTLADCTQDVLEDGPKRDRRLWLGDLRLLALTSYISFRSLGLIKRCLYLFAGTRFPDGRMSANVFTDGAPVADDTYLMDFALLYPVALNEYLDETGDREALEDLLEIALEQVEHVLCHELDENGAVKNESAKMGLIDWSDDLNRAASLQGVLIYALDAAAALCEKSGDEARRKRYEEQAEKLRRAALDRFWSEEEGCFVSYGQIAIHSQIWLTLAGVTPEGKALSAFEKALNMKGAIRMSTPYMHHYYIMALLKAGCKAEAERHMREYWGGMVKAGADTFWECWNPEDPNESPYGGKIANSFCHAWSCTPAYLIVKYFN